ncbi:hypothetical protein G6F56_012643 [Rhizopus delemar]|nr:hypothetical protein G6F56_012643 [Rhizopus delemar]
MEIVVWDPKKSTLDDIEIYKSFDWPESFDIKGSRFKVMEKNGLKVLIAGDYEGNIHIFDIDNVRSKTLSDNSKEVMNPTRILSHETSNAVIRDISLSSDTRCIVAIDINNNTFVWTCTTAN